MSEITGLGARELRLALGRGQLTALEVVRAFLDRAADVDGSLHALLRLNPRIEDEALEADRRLGSGDAGPLCGIPVVVKDNIATRGMATTCASKMLEDFIPVRDATAVLRLRAAGAVILGKSNMDEFGMGSSTESSAFGVTRNPWDLERVPGGSSGGSAAAVAARIAPLALGSDTGGSVRQPAAFCGIVGLKPTYGRVSRSGLVAYGSSLDQIGCMTGDVADCARLLGAIAGSDPADATSAPVAGDDYEAGSEAGVRGLRVGLAREQLGDGIDDEIECAARHAAELLAAAGAEVVEVSLPHLSYAIPAYYLVATAEASSNLARYDGTRYGWRAAEAHDLPTLYRATREQGFGDEVKRRILLGTYALSAGYHDAYYGKAMEVRDLLRREYRRMFASGIDLLLGPTTPTPAFRIGEKTDDPVAMYLSDIFTVTANLVGIPALSLPVGQTEGGLPIGIQLSGPEFAETILLRAARVIEAAVGRQVPPPRGRKARAPGQP